MSIREWATRLVMLLASIILFPANSTNAALEPLPSSSSSQQSSSSQSIGWTPDNVPNPKRDPVACGLHLDTKNSWVCNPDHVLDGITVTKINDAIEQMNRDTTNRDWHSCHDGNQMGLLVIQRTAAGLPSKDAAGVFTRAVHNAWGIGSASCNNGLMVMISIDDRKMFGSTGRGITDVLSDSSIDDIFGDMKEAMRARAYNRAILTAVEKFIKALKKDKDDLWWESATTAIILTAILLFFCCVSPLWYIPAWCIAQLHDLPMRCRQRREQSRLQRLRSQIAVTPASKPYIEATMCPICLTDFQMGEPETTAPAATTAAVSSTTSNASVSSSLSSSSSMMNESKDVSSDNEEKTSLLTDDNPLRRRRSSRGGDAISSTTPTTPVLANDNGSIGHHITITGHRRIIEAGVEVLWCGHTFHSACVNRWLSTRAGLSAAGIVPTGTHNSCPVCRRPNPRRPTPPPPPSSSANDAAANEHKGSGQHDNSNNNNNGGSGGNCQAEYDAHDWPAARMDAAAVDFSLEQLAMHHVLTSQSSWAPRVQSVYNTMWASSATGATDASSSSSAGSSWSGGSDFGGGGSDGGGGGGGDW